MSKKHVWFVVAIGLLNAIAIELGLYGLTWLIGVNGLALACYYLIGKKLSDGAKKLS